MCVFLCVFLCVCVCSCVLRPHVHFEVKSTHLCCFNDNVLGKAADELLDVVNFTLQAVILILERLRLRCNALQRILIPVGYVQEEA